MRLLTHVLAHGLLMDTFQRFCYSLWCRCRHATATDWYLFAVSVVHH